MKTLDFTFPTPEENLACDEALLDLCERGSSDEILRFWAPERHFIVLGLSNSAPTELHLPAAQARSIPILRRCSGGGTVLQGPGCLNFALILKIKKPGPLESIGSTNQHILERHRAALEKRLRREVSVQGCTDLTLDGLKFSGNSQRRRMRSLLFHGTFLLHLDLTLMEELLAIPSRQPSYRRGRSHGRFLTHLPLSADPIKEALRETWGANGVADPPPGEEIRRLVDSRYSREDWNLRIILP